MFFEFYLSLYFGIMGNEFELINEIRGRFPKFLGDDCAVVNSLDGKLLLTTDEMVENIHFSLDYFSYEDIGYKAVSSASSDIAAMGGVVDGVLLAIAIPEKFDGENLASLYDGIHTFCKCKNIEIFGGNISRTQNEFHIVTTVLGHCERPIMRSGAKIGDTIYITGTLGGAKAGYFVASGKFDGEISPLERDLLSIRHRRPRARLDVGKFLGEIGKISAMLDISDGFWSDLMHIAEESDVGVDIELSKIPLYPGVGKIAKWLNIDPYILAARSGEEYELLFTAPSEIGEQLQKILLDELDVPITAVGKITQSGRIAKLNGEKIQSEKLMGWEH